MIKLPIKYQQLKVMSKAFRKENSKHGIQIENAKCLIFQVKKFYVASRCADPHNWCGIKCCKNVDVLVLAFKSQLLQYLHHGMEVSADIGTYFNILEVET